MKFTYPAVFHKTEQGTYEGYFPDLACCYAKGDTLDEALEDAIHSAYDWISLELTEEEPDFPPVWIYQRSFRRYRMWQISGKAKVKLQEILPSTSGFLRDGTNKFKKEKENRIAAIFETRRYGFLFISSRFSASLFLLC